MNAEKRKRSKTNDKYTLYKNTMTISKQKKVKLFAEFHFFVHELSFAFILS